MKHPDRLRRPDLERSEPVRSFSTLFAAPSATAAEAATDADGNGSPSLSDVVTHSVDLGYFPDLSRSDKATKRHAERDALEGGVRLVALPSEEADARIRLHRATPPGS